ncbi:MAG: hypothetical protein WA160_16150 [Pseudobdellovibrio sp.]
MNQFILLVFLCPMVLITSGCDCKSGKVCGYSSEDPQPIVQTEFSMAATGDLNGIKNYIQNGGDPNKADATGFNLLQWAAMYNQEDILQYLLSVGSNPTKPEIAPYISADRIVGKYTRMLLMLENAGASLTATNGLGHQLFTSSQCASSDFGQKPNQDECLQVMELLHGRNIQIDYQNEKGETSLMSAGNFGMAKLIAWKANLNLQDIEGESALQKFARDLKSDRVSLLTQNGANPNLLDKSGCSPLYDTVTRFVYPFQVEVQFLTAQLLINAGADPLVKPCSVRKMLETAKINQNSKLVDLLIQHGVTE